jgi:hypothetical protein
MVKGSENNCSWRLWLGIHSGQMQSCYGPIRVSDLPRGKNVRHVTLANGTTPVKTKCGFESNLSIVNHLCLQSMRTVPILPAIMVFALASWIPPLSQTWSCRAFAPPVNRVISFKQRNSCLTNEFLVGSSSGIIVPFRPSCPLTQHSLRASGSGGNFMDRVSRAAKSNVNQMASNLESDEKGIVRAIEDLKVTFGRRLASARCEPYFENETQSSCCSYHSVRPIGNRFVKPMWKPGPVMVA